MEGLIPLQDGRVGSLEASHDLLSVSDFTIEAFHLVIVDGTGEPDVSDVDGLGVGVELLHEGLEEVLASVSYQCDRPLASDRLALSEEGSDISRELGVRDFLGYPESGLVVHHGEEILHVALDFDQ